MKKLSLLFTIICTILFVSSCTTTTTVKTNKNGIPPGQMKKITGSQSAKPYAPGQNK